MDPSRWRSGVIYGAGEVCCRRGIKNNHCRGPVYIWKGNTVPASGEVDGWVRKGSEEATGSNGNVLFRHILSGRWKLGN